MHFGTYTDVTMVIQSCDASVGDNLIALIPKSSQQTPSRRASRLHTSNNKTDSNLS